MTPEPTDWIAMSERRPKATDLPVWYCWPNNEITLVEKGPEGFEARFWRHAHVPIPPPKPRSQREGDEEAFHAYMNDDRRERGCLRIWLSALAYRDAQNRADLEILTGAVSPYPAFDRLRSRAGL